jgi:hypothetical protein
MNLHRRPLLGLLASLALPAQAQSNWARVAVPSYTAVHLLQGLHAHWMAPQADAFAGAAQALVPALQQYGAAPTDASLDAARAQWLLTTRAWERLSALALGPLLERRSMRRIDFTPTRPALIERAVVTAPKGALALERIGTPAKGLPALEWLLWTKAMTRAACAYAVELGIEIEQEAAALQAQFRALAERGPDEWTEALAIAGMGEFVNQWVGGIERLRWAQMEKPLRSGRKAELPRATSGSTAASWAAQWLSLRAMALFQGRAAPAPGAGLVTIESYLRGRGANAVADRLVKAVAQVDRDLQGLSPAAPVAHVLQAAKALAALKGLAETTLAPALEVSIGFSDADGD